MLNKTCRPLLQGFIQNHAVPKKQVQEVNKYIHYTEPDGGIESVVQKNKGLMTELDGCMEHLTLKKRGLV